MRKSLIAAAIAGTVALPSAVMAQAAAPASPHTFTPNVGIVSDYLFRGVSQTRGGAALQGGVDYSHSSGTKRQASSKHLTKGTSLWKKP
jgi:uncharacterized protein (TIGR02001 family)